MGFCRVCGKENCRQHILNFSNKITEFTGSSPPEIFVGQWDYPNVYVGILSPQEQGNTELLSSQELWHKNRLSIPNILNLRNKLIYGRKKGNIKKTLFEEKEKSFISAFREIALTSKSTLTEFKLKKPIEENKENNSFTPVIKKAANLKEVKIQENPKIEKKVDYLVNDIDSKAENSILELEKSYISTSQIIKILSAGLLGLKTQRKLVPTKWAITATDDILSKNKLENIKQYSEISEISIFTSEYLGNHYEFLLLPDNFNFEVIEINNKNLLFWHDYESFFGRKNYAESVTGAYYANRLALCEYLQKIKKQASCIVFREISEEYTQSVGVGILRQISREAFSQQPEKASTIKEALDKIQSRIKLNITEFTNRSKIIKEYGKQKKLSSWL